MTLSLKATLLLDPQAFHTPPAIRYTDRGFDLEMDPSVFFAAVEIQSVFCLSMYDL